MKKILLIASCLAFFASNVCFGQKDLSIIPYPQSLEMHSGSFKLAGASFCLQGIDENATSAIKAFASQLSFVSGKMNHFINEPKGRCVIFNVDQKLANEEYALTVTRKKVTVSASSYNGFLYAIETLKQMLPISIYGKIAAPKDKWALQCVKIQDKPRFAYRGMHLDCARHFFSVAEVKKYLEIMAIYKLNTFHWHLTEDQGWRIEIKKYPKLTQIGAFRDGTMIGHDLASNDGIRYGGFYTQDQVKDIVAYAQKLGITIIPETDLPGHMVAALASYPELACTGGPYDVRKIWGIADQVLCAGKDETYRFLDEVLCEVADIFPGELFHIGGDECPKVEWEKCPHCQAKIAELGLEDKDGVSAEQYLQNYVPHHVQKTLASKGKRIIGWDEITEGELDKGVAVMFWRGWLPVEKTLGKYTADGYDVIMTPTSYFYIDYLQSEDMDSEPVGFQSGLTIDKMYSFDLTKGLSPEQLSHIKGVQANLWTEYVSTWEHAEYMLFPRLFALSCIAWDGDERPDFESFMGEVKTHQFPVLDNWGYNYRNR